MSDATFADDVVTVREYRCDEHVEGAPNDSYEHVSAEVRDAVDRLDGYLAQTGG